MESLGTLAGGIAHDFNNILSIILGHASILHQVSKDPREFSSSIDAIRKATDRGTSLVKQLLTFARKTESLFESIRINEIVQELVRLLQETLSKTVEIQTELADSLPSVLGDSTQLHQVFLNLCLNARDAMPGGGTLSISTKLVANQFVEEKFPGADSAEYVQVTVRDTGVGMDETTRRRMFEPFFTTKEHGKGTGLGMALVYGIIESHRGFIDVESEPGRGTVFTIFLPTQPTVPNEKKPDVEKPEMLEGSETILFVEDEEMLQSFIKKSLEQHGYRVLTACDGDEALRVYPRSQNEISLVVSDLGLPKKSGDQVFLAMKQINPAVRMILASGYIDPDLKNRLESAGVKQLLPKPCAPVDILRAIRRLIDSR